MIFAKDRSILVSPLDIVLPVPSRVKVMGPAPAFVSMENPPVIADDETQKTPETSNPGGKSTVIIPSFGIPIVDASGTSNCTS